MNSVYKLNKNKQLAGKENAQNKSQKNTNAHTKDFILVRSS